MSELIEKVARAMVASKDGWPDADAGGCKVWQMYDTEARAAIAAVAEWMRPSTERPCDCTTCYCGNAGDTEQVAYWDADNWRYVELMKQLEQPK